MAWNFAAVSAKPGGSLATEFIIPYNVVSVEPRVVGCGRTGVAVSDFKIESRGNCLPRKEEFPKSIVAETELLKVSIASSGAAISVEDKRTRRIWTPVKAGGLLVTKIEKNGHMIKAGFLDPETRLERYIVVELVADRAEVLVTVAGGGEMHDGTEYPPAFVTRKGDRLIVPMNEGIGYPVDEKDEIPERLATFSGHGVCMAFFGVQTDTTGSGYMGIVETADDAVVVCRRSGMENLYSIGVRWEAQKGDFGYARRIRYVFFDRGGYVAMCKRYRSYVKKVGRFKTFAEKRLTRPYVDRLLGAPNIWCRTSDPVAMAKKIKGVGIDRFLWSAGGDAKAVTELSKMDGVLVSHYDVYHDIYRPEQLKKLDLKEGINMDAWPDGAVWNSADSNNWRKAWGVKAKDGTWTFCACMCDAVSAQYCRKHVSRELKTKPYNTRFIDVATAAAWDTCYNPAHPMTRSDSRRCRMDLLRLLGDEYGLVVGSETGHDAAVPYCDYFEGMLSLCTYRVPDSGRNLDQIWTNVPPNVAKYQLGAAYRLPLWELVYHECLCAHWYWGDYNNKLPTLWDGRDLFNVLYGTMGMYFFKEEEWKRLASRFVQSYHMTADVARRTGYSEMLDHICLSPDRQVQRTRFANGVVVTVNFGTVPFVLPGGGRIDAGGCRVED